eukprot:c21740_g1_i1 orf=72-1394(+)
MAATVWSGKALCPACCRPRALLLGGHLVSSSSPSSFLRAPSPLRPLCSSAGGQQQAPYPPPLFSVAPMMDYTDNHFRTFARLLTRHTWLYTEMVVADTIVHQEKNLDRFLDFPEMQHPIVLQLGGSDVSTLAKATRLANAYGYDEINLNCGCPSDKVAGHGCFGARLMLDPKLVGHAMAAIAENCSVPVSVKCRIGVDDAESYDELCTFVNTVATLSPTRHFIIHARKAILKGISPAANRKVPPLKYEYVFALIRDFPDLKFTINGGIISIGQVEAALEMGAYGVMVGRASYNSPWSLLARVDSDFYGVHRPFMTRRELLSSYEKYADSVLGKYGPGRPSLRHTIKPLLHLFHAEQSAGLWRRAVDEAFRECSSCSELLKRTLPVLPDHVLDAPPPPPGSIDENPFVVASNLPDEPSFLQKIQSNSVVSSIEPPGLVVCA